MIPDSLVGMILNRLLPLTLVAMLAALGSSPAGASSRPIVVTGVTQWAALARQVAGPDATVVSLVTDPNADPHQHEATFTDAAHVASASIVIVNGAGYDTWLSKLVQGRSSAPTVFNVATMVHAKLGANPHFFYDVSAAQKFVATFSTLLNRHGNLPGVAKRAKSLELALSMIARTLVVVHHACAGVAVAATEDVTGYLLSALGLNVVTPRLLRLAIGNGVDPTVRDLATALDQLRNHVAFLVNNVQTATPLTAQLVARAKSVHVPVLNVTETMRTGTYTQWLGGIIGTMRADLHQEGCLS